MKRIKKPRVMRGFLIYPYYSVTSSAFAILPCNWPVQRAMFMNVVHSMKPPKINKGYDHVGKK